MKEESNTILDQAEQYFNTTKELYSLKLTGKIATVVSTLVTQLVIGMLTIIVLFMLSMGFALWLGDLLGHGFLGFLIIGGVVGIVTVYVYVRRHKLIRKPIMENIISEILK